MHAPPISAGRPGTDHRADVRVEYWGPLGYAAALERQRGIVTARIAGVAPDTIVAVEHPPTITLGRNAPSTDVVATPAVLRERGIELVKTDRGGRATYHGPGQAVVYPIVGIADRGLGVKPWVAMLEEAMIGTLASFGLSARRRPETPGLWVGSAKIASVGLRVERGVSYHGVSMNIGLDVSGFDAIVTCGIAGQPVTSVAAEIGSDPGVREASSRLSREICNHLRS
ncbi:MAG: lipoyl(octanoyl) transferase LipB [Myxococcales bacterium]|nr:MAG: lipoyl(octanoyl) transferase LipB [Myxococcales bacterium]